MRMRVSLVALLLLAALGIGGEHARAESYPSRPVRIVVPFAAGGALDVLARLIGGKLSDAMGQPV
jgi:tripartite-type tricarboxylate transporter receptor subunit TctC